MLALISLNTRKEDINKFIRIDDVVKQLVYPHVNVAKTLDKRYLVVTLKCAANNDQQLIHWLKHQDKETYAIEKNRIVIGLSISTLDEKELAEAVNVGLVFLMPPLLERSAIAHATNHNVFYFEKISQLFVRRTNVAKVSTPQEVDSCPVPNMNTDTTELEKKFVESLTGHDFWYEYSDSSSVYHAGRNRHEALIQEGVNTGLTRKRCEELYSQTYQSKSK